MKALLPSLLRRGALLLAACLTSSAALAQTISVTPPNQTCTALGNGQSFRATLTGTVAAISVQPVGNIAGVTLRIYNGGTGSGQAGAVGTPAYSQSGINLLSAPPGTWRTINLTTSFPVVAGSSYSFTLEPEVTLRCSTTDPYPSGTWIGNFVPILAQFDIVFQIFESAAVPVPTLSEWALILLAGSLGLAGCTAVWRRHRV